ncbi:MAG TPA: nickel pincer cofactor biosynthesis protein LarB [Armatimonadota bacterium]|nr:nickel pincer cofactor biosynthesis protein LarB [Armatimonadota bacterium]
MNDQSLRDILDSVKSGELSVQEAVGRLRHLPYEDLGFAKVDHHRSLRTGFPEVIFCQGKSSEQVVEIIKRLAERNPVVLATRADEAIYEAVRKAVPHAVYHRQARMIVVRKDEPQPETDKYMMVVSAGTADIPVAEEAAVTAESMGSKVERVYDIGVAGIHRLLDQKDKLRNANVIIVVAGMEGALASVVGGLVDKPVIAVPTSIGYGSSFEGLAALLSMLNTCAEGVAVVNIDNGFGAGYFAHLINR